jgi:hypothetical protein
VVATEYSTMQSLLVVAKMQSLLIGVQGKVMTDSYKISSRDLAQYRSRHG